MWQYFAITQNFISCERATKGRKATKGSRYVSIHRCLLSLWWKPSFVSSVWRSWLFFRAAHLLIRPPDRDFLISVSVPSVIKPSFCVRHPSLRPHFLKHFYSLWRESCRASVRCLIFFFLSAPQFFWRGCWRRKGETWTSGTASKQIFSYRVCLTTTCSCVDEAGRETTKTCCKELII